MNIVPLFFNVRELRKRKAKTSVARWFIALSLLGVGISLALFYWYWFYLPMTRLTIQIYPNPVIRAWRFYGIVSTGSFWLVWSDGLYLVSAQLCKKYRQID